MIDWYIHKMCSINFHIFMSHAKGFFVVYISFSYINITLGLEHHLDIFSACLQHLI